MPRALRKPRARLLTFVACIVEKQDLQVFLAWVLGFVGVSLCRPRNVLLRTDVNLTLCNVLFFFVQVLDLPVYSRAESSLVSYSAQPLCVMLPSLPWQH